MSNSKRSPVSPLDMEMDMEMDMDMDMEMDMDTDMDVTKFVLSRGLYPSCPDIIINKRKTMVSPRGQKKSDNIYVN